jgi:hypothetical protein
MLNLIVVFVLLTACKKTNTDQVEDNNITSSPQPTVAPEVTVTEVPDLEDPTNEEPEDLKTTKDYYPFKADTRYIYEGEGNEYASYRVYTDYFNNNRIQTRTDNGGTELVKVLEIKEGKLVEIFTKGEAYYRENLLDSVNANADILLMEPIEIGTSWMLNDNSKRYISNIDKEVITPAGTFQTIEVTTEYEESKQFDYYAKGVGLVKTVFSSEGMEVTSTLSSVEENTSLLQTILFYYPNVDKDVIYKQYKEINFKTNDITSEKLMDGMKEITEEKYEPLISTNTKINSLYLNTDNVVYVDFSGELINEMSAGARYEEMILQSITNILGTYYGVEQVMITVEGKPYESGHIYMKEGETFKVNLEMVQD